MDTIASLGAALLSIALGFALIIGAGYAGVKTSERTGKKWLGWIVGLTAFAILCLLFGPSYEALRRESCKDAYDFEACIDGD